MPTLAELSAAVANGTMTLDDVRTLVGSSAASGQGALNDQIYLQSPAQIAVRIQQIYNNAGATFTAGTGATPPPTGVQPGPLNPTTGMPTYGTGETEQQRIDRLVADVMAGRTTLANIRTSIYGTAGQTAPSSHEILANDAVIASQGPAAVEARIRAMFANTGQSIATWQATDDGIPDNELASARATIERILADYGLGSLSGWAWQRLQDGAPVDLILLELEQRPEFDAAFPEIRLIRERNAAGGGPAMTPMRPADIINYRATARRILGNAGLPEGFYDQNSDFTDLIVRGVSTLELADRVEQGFQQVATARPEIREAFADYFGVVGDAALAAWFLDPSRATSVLVEQRQAAVAGGIGRSFGFDIGAASALRLAGSDIEAQRAMQGFAELARVRPLFDELLGEAQDFTAEGEGVDALFDLGGPGAELLRQRLTNRSAAFRGGGGAILTEEGVGFGSVDT